MDHHPQYCWKNGEENRYYAILVDNTHPILVEFEAANGWPDVQDRGPMSWLAGTTIPVKATNIPASERTPVLINSRSRWTIVSQRVVSRDEPGDM
jgi:hypothetical protein